MEGKKFNSVTKVTTVNSNQSLLLTDQNGNVTSIGMDALKADLAVGQHAWCGRVWDTANATPKAASYIGSLELLKELPYVLGLGAYLVKNDHSRRKLDSKDHHKYATGEPARVGFAQPCDIHPLSQFCSVSFSVHIMIRMQSMPTRMPTASSKVDSEQA